MNDEVQASIAQQMTELTRVVDPPVAPFVYGRDLSCVTDLSPTLAEVDPSSPRAIVEAVIRRFTTPRGGLADDADYGLDIRAHVNRGHTERDLRALSGALGGEARKDDRVSEASVQLSAAVNSSEMTVHVVIVPADPALHDFDFTFAVTSGDVLGVTIHA